jgi:Fe-S-cluster-containing dehydrogenase component
MAKYGLLIDYNYCTGCLSCEFACSQENDIPLGQWGIKVTQIGPWPISGDKYTYIPVPTGLCNLCGKRVAKGKQPSCVHHCQAGVMSFGTVEELAKQMVDKPKQVLFTPH